MTTTWTWDDYNAAQLADCIARCRNDSERAHVLRIKAAVIAEARDWTMREARGAVDAMLAHGQEILRTHELLRCDCGTTYPRCDANERIVSHYDAPRAGTSEIYVLERLVPRR